MDKIEKAVKITEPMIVFLYYSGHAIDYGGSLRLVMPDHTKN
jgi:hypothetical protein